MISIYKKTYVSFRKCDQNNESFPGLNFSRFTNLHWFPHCFAGKKRCLNLKNIWVVDWLMVFLHPIFFYTYHIKSNFIISPPFMCSVDMTFKNMFKFKPLRKVTLLVVEFRKEEGRRGVKFTQKKYLRESRSHIGKWESRSH